MTLPIQANINACRILKHLPPAPGTAPPQSVLAALVIVEQEELFQGQMWAQFDTQRQIAADPSAACRVVVLETRPATVEKTCSARINGSTALIGELIDPTGPAPSAPTLSEEPLPDTPCTGTPHSPVIPDGVARIDAGAAAQCVWNSAVVSGHLAKLAALVGKPAPRSRRSGHLPLRGPALLPVPSLLASRYADGENDALHHAPDVANILGDTAAFGNLSLAAFEPKAMIAASRFTAGAVSEFIHRPTKVSLPTAN